MTKWEGNSLPANGGNGHYSYLKNSDYQRIAVNVVKDKIEAAIMSNLDVDKILSTSKAICLADFGCAVGPNTFISMQNILECVKRKHISLYPTSNNIPEFMIFFNDLPSNDFNTLFSSLPPDRTYFAVGLPGSFHGRLLPEASLHLVHSVSSLHWLSRVPDELLNENSRAWNKGRVHYTSAPVEVVKAYRDQFAKDMEDFLKSRAMEMVGGGMMIITTAGIPDGMAHSQLPAGIMYDLMASCLLEMAEEGLITEHEVDSFNLPMYAASPKEIKGIVEKNGCFTIETLELTNPAATLNAPIDMQRWTDHIRAVMESIFVANFGDQVIDDFFNLLVRKLLQNADRVESSYKEKIQLLVILNRT